MLNFRGMNKGLKVVTIGLVILLIGFFVSLFGKKFGDKPVQDVGILVFVFSFAVSGIGIIMHLYSAVLKWVAQLRNRMR